MTSASNFDKRLLGLGSPAEAVPGLPVNSATDTITAHAGGGQALGVPLVSEINRVTVVATAADSVQLPQAVAGLSVQVANASGNALAVFPFLGDNINGGSTNAVYSLAAGKTAMFYSASTLNWHALLSA